MKYADAFAITIVLLCGLVATDARAWGGKEHRLLGDSVYFGVMRQGAVPSGDSAFVLGEQERMFTLNNNFWGDKTFGQLCSLLAKDDFAHCRFHERGKTILEQLLPLSAEHIDASWREIALFAENEAAVGAAQTAMQLPKVSHQNVVTAYLLHHLLALRLAEQAGRSDGKSQLLLCKALFMEAIAQGYLADAFSAGHLLVPLSDPLTPLHSRNNREAHHHHGNFGVYVINSRGDVWQTFGDQLMHWYAPTYRCVLEACRYSLREVLVVFYYTGGHRIPGELKSWLDSAAPGIPLEQIVSSWVSNRDGVEYYATLRMPTLMLLPMPVAASWSIRTEELDEHGIRRRRHFPQLHEEGLHDPDLTNIDREFLYHRSGIPDWLIPQPFLNVPPASPDSLTKTHPDWASVRWVQDRYAPPSYKGTLVHFGGQITFHDGSVRAGGLLGIGYGLWDDLILLKNVSFSAVILPSVHEPRRLLLVPSVGGGLAIGSGRLKALRVEGGLAIGLRSEYDDIGSMLAVGIDSRTYALRFTNAGITWRLKYQWFHLDRLLHGLALELILH